MSLEHVGPRALPCLPPWPQAGPTSCLVLGPPPCPPRAGRTPRTRAARDSGHGRPAWPRDGVLCVYPHRDSCQRGWRLLYILTAYHSCSEVLRPPLVHFLQDVSQSPGLPFQGEGHSKGARAEACPRGYQPGSQQEGKSREPGPTWCLGHVRPDASPPRCDGGPAGAGARLSVSGKGGRSEER